MIKIPSARSPQLDPLFKRREEILSKPKLTPEDEAELKEIAQKIASLPTGENAQDIEAMDIIRRAAKLSEKKVKS